MTATGRSSTRRADRSRPAGSAGPGRRRRRGVRVLGVLLVLVLVGGWLYLIYGSPVFAARSVEVTGTARLSKNEVTSAAAVPLGTPLARIDMSAVASRVQRLPRVEKADVGRGWPSTVRVRITERVPVATVERNGTWWVLDDEAVVVQTATKRPRLPVLDLARPTPRDATTRSALAVVDKLPVKLSRRTQKVTAETPDSVQLHLPKRKTVVWGNARDSAKKARVYATLRKAQPRGKTYDVSTPDTPTVTRK